jgi:hypothetical protein
MRGSYPTRSLTLLKPLVYLFAAGKIGIARQTTFYGNQPHPPGPLSIKSSTTGTHFISGLGFYAAIELFLKITIMVDA